MEKARLDVINSANVWVMAEDKEKVRNLAEDILNGAVVLNTFDSNIRLVLKWLEINGRGLQKDGATKWLERHN